MSKAKELRIHSSLWVEIVNVRDVVLSKLSVRAEYDAKYDLTGYVVEYDGGSFWLVIDDLKGYFDFSDGVGFLKLLFKSKEQETFYDQVWKQIVSITGSSGMIKDSVKIRLNSDDLPVGREFKINMVTAVVKIVVDINNKFYPQISLNYCSYEVNSNN